MDQGQGTFDERQRGVSIIGTSPGALALARTAVDASGAETLAATLLDDLDPLTLRRVSVDLVYLELDRDDPVLDGLLHQIASIGRPALIAFPQPLIDIVAGADAARNVRLLCEPDQTERVFELVTLLSAGGMALNDISADRQSERLRQLREDASRLARSLAELTEPRPLPGGPAPPPAPLEPAAPMPPGERINAAAIRAIIRARRLRGQFFQPDLFADPAWDMLLDLAASRLERVPVAVSSLCIAAAVPPTTALRWISRLVEEGHVVRVPDPRDGRRVFIELTDTAADLMMSCLEAARAMAVR